MDCPVPSLALWSPSLELEVALLQRLLPFTQQALFPDLVRLAR
jgi:hypothetical protein